MPAKIGSAGSYLPACLISSDGSALHLDFEQECAHPFLGPQTWQSIAKKCAEQVLILRSWPNTALAWFPVSHQFCLAGALMH
eukprot:1158258-Pelagomonas_calceolata.AAC.4